VALHSLAIQMLAAALAVAHTWVSCSRLVLQAPCSGGWGPGLFSGAGAEMEAAGACLEEAAFWGGRRGADPCLGRAAVVLMGRVLPLACLPLPLVPQA
jgi:hypothetical protein